MRIPLAKWAPDLPGLAGANSNSEALNVYPDNQGYRPINDLSAVSSNALNAQCLGAIAAQDYAGVTTIFAGNASKLYSYSGGSFTDVSKGGGYSATTSSPWKFAQFGEYVLATDSADAVQYWLLNSSSAFADLSGPPNSKCIAVVRDFTVVGNTTNSIREVYWSGFNNVTQWTKGINQCDAQTLPNGGAIQQITGGETGIIWQERSITQMTYVGTPVVFRFDKVADNHGLAAPGAVVKFGDSYFYWSTDGFYTYTPGSSPQPVGNQRVDDWFSANISAGSLSLISGTADPVNKLVLMGFVSVNAMSATSPDHVLIYNYATGDFTHAAINHEFLFRALQAGVTLEQLSAIYPIIENVPASFDSTVWAGGAVFLGAFNSSHYLASLTGSTLAATMATSDFEPVQGRRALINNARAHCDTSSGAIVVQARERFADALVSTAQAPMQTNGDCPMLSSGRYFRGQLVIPAGTSWTFANALDFQAQDDGEL